jgi:hypothetical protein
VNFGTPVPLLVGIVFILVAVGLFFLDKFKPGYKRDSDTVYSILFLTVGILSLFQLNQEFLPSFQLMIFAGMLIALMLESIRRRTPGGANSLRPEPAGRPEPMGRAESSRPPREPRRAERNYGYNSYEVEEPRYKSEIQAEFDDEPVMFDQSPPRQIRGGRDSRESSRNRDYAEVDPYRDDRDDYRRDNAAEFNDPPQESRESRRERRRSRNSERASNERANPESEWDTSATTASERPSRRRGSSLDSDEGSWGDSSRSSSYSPDYGSNDYGNSASERSNTSESVDLLGRGSRRSRPATTTTVNDDPYSGAPRRRPKPKLNLEEDDAPVSSNYADQPADNENAASSDAYVDYQPLDKPLRSSSSDRRADDTADAPEGNNAPLRPSRRRRSENLGNSGLGDPLDLSGTGDDF